MRLLVLLFAAALVCSCGKPQEQAKTAEQIKSERDDAGKRARENPVYGEQLKSLDKARAVQDALGKQAEEAGKQIDEQSK